MTNLKKAKDGVNNAAVVLLSLPFLNTKTKRIIAAIAAALAAGFGAYEGFLTE